MFAKSDLKDGDIVTHRNGDKRVKAGYKLSNKTGFLFKDDLREDLTVKSNMKQHDIIKVERPIKYETVYERKEEMLDEAEKRYLRAVIRPFKDRIEGLKKRENKYGEEILIFYTTDYKFSLLPFQKNTMYKNMELGKEYSLKELRTIKE